MYQTQEEGVVTVVAAAGDVVIRFFSKRSSGGVYKTNNASANRFRFVNRFHNLFGVAGGGAYDYNGIFGEFFIAQSVEISGMLCMILQGGQRFQRFLNGPGIGDGAANADEEDVREPFLAQLVSNLDDLFFVGERSLLRALPFSQDRTLT